MPYTPPRMADRRAHPVYAGLKRFRAGWFALLTATGIGIVLCWLMLRPFVEVLLWAGVLVIIFYPTHKEILDRTRQPSLAALLSCFLVATVILLPLTFLTVVVFQEADTATVWLQQHWVGLLDPKAHHVQILSRFVNVDRFRTTEGIKEALEPVRDYLVLSGPDIAAWILGTLLKIFFVAFTMYYLFRDAERVRESLRDMLPLQPSQSAQIFHRTREVINASVNGVMVIAIIQGFLGGIAFWFLGLPSPLLWGAIMTLLSMVPLVGSTVVWIPTALYLFANGEWGKAIFLVIWGGAVITSVDTFLRPRLVGGKTRLHELLVFFSVVGGLRVFGILGIVVGPVVVAITLSLLDVFRKADRPLAQTLGEKTLLEHQAALREVPPDVLPPDDTAERPSAA